MSNPEKTTIISAEEVASKLDGLYNEIVQQRSTNRKASLIGLLCVIIVLLILSLKLYGIFSEYQKFANGVDSTELMAALEEDNYQGTISQHKNPEIEEALKAVIKEGRQRLIPAVEQTKDVLVTKILPDFTQRVTDKISDKHDVFGKAGTKLQDDLTKYVEKMVKQDLINIMGTEMMKVSEDLRKEFPELTDAKLRKELEDREAYFYDELHDLGMQKIAKFDPVLRSLSTRIQSLTKGKKMSPEMREQVANDFFEALFDRVKYEFVPGLGEQLVKPPKEGKTNAEKESTTKGGVK